MASDPQQPGPIGDRLGTVTRELHVRVLNCSPTGCLLETNARLEAGVTASLQMTIDGRDLVDDVQVVRCQQIEGAGAVYQIGVRFLWSATPDARALRGVMWRWCHAPTGES